MQTDDMAVAAIDKMNSVLKSCRRGAGRSFPGNNDKKKDTIAIYRTSLACALCDLQEGIASSGAAFVASCAEA